MTARFIFGIVVLLLCVTSVSALTLNDSILFYSFDSGTYNTTHVFDVSGNGLNATLQSTYLFDTGVEGTGYSAYNNESGMNTTGNLPFSGNHARTFSFWYNFSAEPDDYGYIFFTGTMTGSIPSNAKLDLVYDNRAGNQYFNLGRQGGFNRYGFAGNGITPDDGAFHHIVIVYETGEPLNLADFYYDNVTLTANLGASGSALNTATSPLILSNVRGGFASTTFGYSMNGTSDNWGVWDRALNSSEVSALYTGLNPYAVTQEIPPYMNITAQDDQLFAYIRNITVINNDNTSQVWVSNYSTGIVETTIYSNSTSYNLTLVAKYYENKTITGTSGLNVSVLLSRYQPVFNNTFVNTSNATTPPLNLSVILVIPDNFTLIITDDPFVPFDYEIYFAGEGTCPLNDGNTNRSFFLFIILLLLGLFIMGFWLDNSLIALLSSIGFFYSGWLLASCDLMVGGLVITFAMVGIYLAVSQLSLTGQSE